MHDADKRALVTVNGRTSNFCGHHCPPWGHCDLPNGHDGPHGWDYDAGEPAYVVGLDGTGRIKFTGSKRV